MNIPWLILMIIIFLIGGALIGIISAKLRRIFNSFIMAMISSYLGGQFMMWGMPTQEPVHGILFGTLIVGVIAGYLFGLRVFPRKQSTDSPSND